MQLVAATAGQMLVHIDPHEINDSDEYQFRPALDATCGRYAQAAALDHGQRRDGCNQRVAQRARTVFEQLHPTKIGGHHARPVEVAFLRFVVRSKPHAVRCRVEDHTAPLPETNRAYRWMTSIRDMALPRTACHAKSC